MSRYSDQIRDEYGRTVPKVSIYVYKWDAYAQVAGDLETLTDDLSAPLANPLTSDADGLYYFNSADGQKLIEYHFGGKVQFRDLIQIGPVPVAQAVFGGFFVNAHLLSPPIGMDAISTTGYSALGVGAANYIYDATVDAAYVTANPRSSFMSANSRGFRLDPSQGIDIYMFGADGGGIVDDADARDALVSFLAANKNNLAAGAGFYYGTPRLQWPQGHFYFSRGLSLKLTVWWEGQSSALDGGHGTWFDFADEGITIERYNTLGTGSAAATTGADGSIIRGIHCTSRAARPSAPNYAANMRHGITLRARAIIEDNSFVGFTGDGAHIYTDAASTYPEGSGVGTNANCSTIRRNRFQYNGRDGIGTDGGDANLITIEANSMEFNSRHGIYGSQFLIINARDNHTASNGFNGTGGSSKGDGLASIVVYPGGGVGTSYYVASAAAAASASTTTPGTNSAVWVPLTEGAGAMSPSTNRPLWVNGTTYKFAAAYFDEGVSRSVWLDNYAEGDQGQPWMGLYSIWFGGVWETNPNAPGLYLDSDAIGRLQMNNGFRANGGSAIVSATENAQLKLFHSSGGSVLQSYNLLSSAYKGMTLDALTLNFQIQTNNVLTLSASLVQAVKPVQIVSDTSSYLEIGRYDAGTPALLKPSSSASGLEIRSPNNAAALTITDASVSAANFMNTAAVYKVAGTQVVGARQTGWTAATGTPARGAFAAAAAGTASGAYVQAEAQAALARIAALEARFIALEADARTHGLIN